MKNAFSLLELIFAIIVISIVASFAIPKYLDTKDTAIVSTIKRDISSIVSSVQTYYLTKGNISKFSDAININPSNWIIEDKKLSDKSFCLSLELKLETNPKKIKLEVDTNKDGICEKFRKHNILSNTYELF